MAEAHWLAGYLAQRALESDSTPTGVLALAAHVFAASELLFEELTASPSGLGGLPERPGPRLTSMSKLRAALSDFVHLGSLDLAHLYGLCVCALGVLDSECGGSLGKGGAAFSLSSVFDDGLSLVREYPLSAPLAGTVRAWRRPAGAWQQIASPRKYEGPAACFTHLDMSWDRPFRKETPTLRPVKQSSAARPHDLGEKGGFSIALCPMMGAYRPTFTVVAGTNGFTVDPRIQPHPELLSQIESTIRVAIGNNIQWLVFPELSVDLAARNATTQHLFGWGSKNTLRSVVAGSFHSAIKVNASFPHEAAGLSGVGRPLFAQRKPGSLELPARRVSGARQGEEPLRELNTPATEVHVMDTAAGRFAVVVASEANCPRLPVFARAARPDFLLILAFSKAPSAFLQVAEELAQSGITTLFVQAHAAVNEGLPPGEADDPVLAFARLSISRDNHAGLPLRWRWRWKAGVETSAAPDAPWAPVSPRFRPLGHVLLAADAPESPLGLVLNIGHVFQRLVPGR